MSINNSLNKVAEILSDFAVVLVKAVIIGTLIFALSMFLIENAHAHSANYDPSTSAGTDKKLNGIHDETNGSVFIACTNDNKVHVSNVKRHADGNSSFDIGSADNSPHCVGSVK